jgi:hypothetical protein
VAKVIARINKKDGTIQFEVDNVIGSSCKSITELLAQGIDVYKEEEKDALFLEAEEPEYIENM